MEKIKIYEIVSKPSGLVIVKYGAENSSGGIDQREATLNTKWQAQQVDYLEKDVGVGGTVDVTIQQKGEYTNITAVDFKSAVKGDVVVGYADGKGNMITTDKKAKFGLDAPKPSRENSIVCQCLLKIASDGLGNVVSEGYGQCICEKLRELVGAYKLGLSLLDG